MTEAPGARGERLRRRHRVLRRSEFREIQSRGRRVHTPHFVLMVLPSATSTEPRLGITVTRKVANAVGRNRIKRLVREVFRRHRAWFPAALDFVFIARTGAAELDYESVREEVRAAQNALSNVARAVRRSTSPPDGSTVQGA